jgi:anti-sigma regulatory factor (Ser/Thr protein kinase)
MEIRSPYFLPIPVQEETQPGSARREAARLAALEGMSVDDVGRVSIIVTEAANNLVKHGQGGEVLLRGCRDAESCSLDVLALDKGKGMLDVADCLRDGYSTAGTAGTGLGAMKRLSDFLEIYSIPNSGTIVHCRIDGNRKPRGNSSTRMESGALVVPVAGETKCGDSFAELFTERHSVYMVVDGLGHGSGAAEAADEAVAAFHRLESVNPLDILDEAHHALRKTRGAAVSVAAIDHNSRKVRFAGVGNVSASVMTPGKIHNMVSHNGIVGHSIPRIQDFTYDWPVGATLAMFSDGITSHWNLAKYPGVQSKSPLMSAAVVYRDSSRRRDDATVLIAREKAARN